MLNMKHLLLAHLGFITQRRGLYNIQKIELNSSHTGNDRRQ